MDKAALFAAVLYVRYWRKADITIELNHVRFWEKNSVIWFTNFLWNNYKSIDLKSSNVSPRGSFFLTIRMA
jgi:hypothetical protein